MNQKTTNNTLANSHQPTNAIAKGFSYENKQTTPMKRSPFKIIGYSLLLLLCLVVGKTAQAQVITEGFEEAVWGPLTTQSAGSTSTATVATYSTTNTILSTSNTGTWLYSSAYPVSTKAGASSASFTTHGGLYAMHIGGSGGAFIATPVITSGVTSVTFWVMGNGSSSAMALYANTNTGFASSGGKSMSASTTASGTVTSASWTNLNTYTIASTGFQSYLYSISNNASNLPVYLKFQRTGGEFTIDDIIINTYVSCTSAGTSNPSATSACIGGSAATMSVTATGTSPTYQWQYSPDNGTTAWLNVANSTPTNISYTNSTTATLSITAATSATTGAGGYYRCVVSVSCNSSTANSTGARLTVNAPSVAANSVSASVSPICNGGSTTLSQSGGILGTGAIWQWYSDAGFTTKVGGQLSTSDASLSVSPIASTTYYVRAEGTTSPCTVNVGDNTKSVTITVNQPSVAATSVSASATTICNGSSSTLTQTGGTLGTGASWKWYSDNTYSTLIGTGSGSNASLSVSPSSTTTYYVRAEGTTSPCTVNIGDNTKSATVTVNTKSSDPTSATASATTICSGSSTTLTLNGGGGGTGESIHWYSGSCGGTSVGTGNNLSVSPTTTTTYYGRYEDGTPCNNSACASVAITVNQSVSISTPSIPGASYTEGATPTDLTISATGTYTLVAYNIGDCASTPSNPVGITVIQTPAKPVVSSTNGTTICNGKNILLISSSAPTYQWYRNGVLLIGASSQTYNATNTGYYSVQSINYGCSSAISDSFVVQKTVNPGFTVNASTQELCSNNFAFTSTTPSSFNNYYWDFGDGTIDHSINPSHTYANKGNYTVKQIITSPNYSCIDSMSQQVSVIKCSYNGVSEMDSVNIYPNPNRGIFKATILSTVARNAKVALIGEESGILFFVRDLVLSEGKNTFSFDLSAPKYKPGIYVVRVITDDMNYSLKRFVITR